jgi:hypothetical protein
LEKLAQINKKNVKKGQKTRFAPTAQQKNKGRAKKL